MSNHLAFLIVSFVLLLTFILVSAIKVKKFPLFLVFVIGLLIRLGFTFIFKDSTNFDLESYKRIGTIVLQGISVYPNHILHYPYLPFFLYLEALAMAIKKIIDPIIFLKILFSLIDLLNVYLVFLLSKKNIKTSLLYAVNPVSVLITNFHGQFDVVPLFFLLLGYYLFNKRRQTASLLALSFGIMVKTWPVLFIFPILKRVEKKSWIILLAFFPVLSIGLYVVLFHSSPQDILSTVIDYRALFWSFGLGKLFYLFVSINRPTINQFVSWVFLGAFLFFSLKNNRKNILVECLRNLLFFYVFTISFAVQYFVWVIPFLLLIRPRFYIALIVLITIFLILNFSPVGNPSLITAINLAVWLLFIKIFTFRSSRD